MGPNKTEPVNEWKGFIKQIFITVIVVFILISFVAQPTTVDGHSMYPTLHDKDQLIIEKVSALFVGYHRYDIIVFPYAQDESKYYIKRIIGMPGETIDIEDGGIQVDGKPLLEPYGFEYIRDFGSQTYPIQVPEGHYFVMGDNRNHSKDSRYKDVGLIDASTIVGKGFLRLYPFKDFGIIEH